MFIRKIRLFLYRFSIPISAILGAAILILLRQFDKVDEILKERSTMLTVAVTLAGFLFAGQGILLSLPSSNRFIQDVKKYGYMIEFHKLCRFSEIGFLLSLAIGFEAFSNDIVDTIFLFMFTFGLTLAIWAIIVFGSIVHRFTRSEILKP